MTLSNGITPRALSPSHQALKSRIEQMDLPELRRRVIYLEGYVFGIFGRPAPIDEFAEAEELLELCQEGSIEPSDLRVELEKMAGGDANLLADFKDRYAWLWHDGTDE